MSRQSACFLFVGFFLLLANSSGADRFGSNAEETSQKLRAGQVLTEGGYEQRVVWAKMVGVVKAPPALVWELFIQSDDWKSYAVPTLIDSRLVSAEVAVAAKKSKQANKFYQILGSQTFPLKRYRSLGQRWSHFSFQYYNVPWPVANRWMVLESKDDETGAAQGRFRSEMTKVAGNILTLEGVISLEPFEGKSNQTRLEYQVRTNPGAHVPRFLVQWGVKKILPAVLQAIRDEARKRQSSFLDNSTRPLSESPQLSFPLAPI